MAPRILVVEDDPVSRELVVSLLADRGFEIETAEDGFNALRMAQERLFDLVLIDYHLPEMDGYALARLMRSLGEKSNAGMKMIAITADQFGLAARRGVDTIFDRLLSKPIDPIAFPKMVDEILCSHTVIEALETFLGSDLAESDETFACIGLWRAHGLDRIPTAIVIPAPTVEQRRNVETCFKIAENASEADCLLLLRAEGLAGVEAIRREGRHFLLPLVVLDEAFVDVADAHFEPGNGESWTSTAKTILGFADRRRCLNLELASSSVLEMRILAFMLVSGRMFELHRKADGQAVVPQSSGFKSADIAAAAKVLLRRDLIRARVIRNADSVAQIVTLEAKSGLTSSHDTQRNAQ